MKNVFERFGFQFEKVAVSGYKSAFDEFTRTEIAPEDEKNTRWLLKTQIQSFKQIISNNRHLNFETIEKLITNSPYLDSEAVEENIIDGIVRTEDLAEYLQTDSDNPIKIVFISKILGMLPISKSPSNKKIIALLPLTGLIVDGESRKPPFPIPLPIIDNEQIGDRTIVQAVRDIRKNTRIKGLILAVDSPGGSASASEEIRAALEKLSQIKPLIAYFTGVSASGGYYISTPANWIIAQPTTITGSIGVISGRINYQGLLNKYEINTAVNQEGERAHWGLPFEPFGVEERASAQKILDQTYNHFIDHVVKSRKNKSYEEIKEIAGGKVWTGSQALENGLVDQLGSLKDAYDKICSLTNVSIKTPLVTIYPSKSENYPPFKSTKQNFSLNYLINNHISQLISTKYWMCDFTSNFEIL